MILAPGLLPLRYRGIWLGVGMLVLLIGLALSLAPLTEPPPVPGADKTVHFVFFTFLTTWFLGIFESHMTWRLAVLLAVYGVLIEALQAFTPNRAAEVADMLANLGGIGAGWLLAAIGLRHWCRRVEALFSAGTA